MLCSFLALTVSNSSLFFTPALLRTHSFVFVAVHETSRIFLSSFMSITLHSFWVSSFHSRTLLLATLALLLVVSSLKSVGCDFSIFSAVMPRSPAPGLTLVRNSAVHSPIYTTSSVMRDPPYENVSACSSCSFWMSMRHAMPSLAITLALSTQMCRL